MNKTMAVASTIAFVVFMAFLSACGAQETPHAPGDQGPPGSAGPGNNIGLSAGGAKDISNFRENIRNDYLPLPTDVTYEGLFYDYYFDTGAARPANKLYSPSYGYAVSRDPLSGKVDYYLSVGLNSGIKESDFQRKKLDLVIVLDNSGSMGESFNQYYYDRAGARRDAYAEEGGSSLRKMDSAAKSVTYILDQLTGDDRVAIVTFNSRAALVQPMTPVWDLDMRDLQERVLDITAGGSTDLEAGLDMATRQFRNLREADSYEFEDRMIVLTDAQPNTGDFSSRGLGGTLEENARNRIYATFIGIGVDFNSDLVERITKIKGANYYSVHSPRQFRERIQDEFDFMVTPLVFNLELRFKSSGWSIDKVFGSPEADQATGRLMSVNTLFPSKALDGEVKGGLVLLKLRKTSSAPDPEVVLEVSYEDRDGREDGDRAAIFLETERPDYYGNSGIRKGILLTRYASLLQNWMIDEREHRDSSRSWQPRMGDDTGIVIPSLARYSQWERQSLPLTVSEPYRRMFVTFTRYFADEMQDIGDDTLDQELTVLRHLSRS
ncbi:MAG: VWA domain-containing protein [Chloroflexi bacterium]|nr:VWA domain-containing protein [Chloroflexota bacterium]